MFDEYIDQFIPDDINWLVGTIAAFLLLMVFMRRARRRKKKRALSSSNVVVPVLPFTPGRVNHWDLSQPLLRWSAWDYGSIADSFEHVLILGASGKGKTSSSGKVHAEAALANGYGALVLTFKNSEVELWRKYCRRTNRTRDLVVFGRGHGFNFVDYECGRPGEGGGLTENIANVLNIGCEISDRSNSQGGGGDAAFWRSVRQQCAKNAIEALRIGLGRVSVPDIYELLSSAPTSTEQKDSKLWRENSFCWKLFREGDRRCSREDEEDFDKAAIYFLETFPNLADKTRSSVALTLTAMLDVLNRGLCRELLCSRTTVRPESVADGRVVILNLPITEFGFVGTIAQGIIKFSFQRAFLRRKIKTDPRPILMWQDEAQHFLTSHDAGFMSACREFRIANVLLFQNVSTFYAALGGEQKGKAEAESIFGNADVRIFHANGDVPTAEYAAKLCGMERQQLMSGNTSLQHGDGVAALLGVSSAQSSAGYSEHMYHAVPPETFSGGLRTGGPRNNYECDALVVRTGRNFADTGRHWRFATFSQKD